MSDIVLRSHDSEKLIDLLAEFFPDNSGADRLLRFVEYEYPIQKRPSFQSGAREAWLQVLSDLREIDPGRPLVAQLLVGITTLWPRATELVELALEYKAGPQIGLSRPVVLVVGNPDVEPNCRWGRELAKIREAGELGYVDVAECPPRSLLPERLKEVQPTILHINGRWDGSTIDFGTEKIMAEKIINCVKECRTDRLRLEGIVVAAGSGYAKHEQHQLIANYVVTHDPHDDGDEFGLRFTTTLYQLIQMAPFHAAVDAAHQLELREAYGARIPAGWWRLSWSAPGSGLVPVAPPAIGGPGKPDGEVVTKSGLSLDDEEVVRLEILAHRLIRDRDDAWRALRLAGLTDQHCHQALDGGSPNWRVAFGIIGAGGVTKPMAYWRLTQWLIQYHGADDEVEKVPDQAPGGLTLNIPDLDRTLSPEDFSEFYQEVSRFSGTDATWPLQRIGYPSRDLRYFPPKDRDRLRKVWDATLRELATGIIRQPRPYRRLLDAMLSSWPANTVFLHTKTADDLAVANAVAVNQSALAVWKVYFLHASPIGRNPQNEERGRLTSEIKMIRAAATAGHIELRDRHDAELLDLSAMLEFQPDILHISGHGEDANLVFADADAAADPVPAEHVAELLAGYRTHGKLDLAGVVLNSCRSAAVAELFWPVADVVIAHRGVVENGPIVEFTGRLYTLLKQTLDLKAAARLAALEVKRVSAPLHDGLVVLPP